ncbi:hypothetical protein [Leptospira ainazelensis]|uniref:hypothetical protein n=1 Tax=Leptospira ainazelensis TaxID=2810034 RepID=UPI001E4D7237|nr:hypothetical protein [Leptospira ainazelensis]
MSNFWDHFAESEHEKHVSNKIIFVKSKNSNSCEYCSSHWGTKVRLFASYSDFENSEFFGGNDTVIHDPNGVKVAAWPGKNNVGRNSRNYWLCCPVHPNCGCEFKDYRFIRSEEKSEELEDWYSKLDF